jgi:hypothetical protein
MWHHAGMGEDAQKFRRIDATEIQRFMEAHRIENPRCPMCGETSWFVGAGGLVPALSIPSVTEEGHVQLGYRTPIIPLFCTNCSYIWLVAYQPVLDWLTKNSSSDKEDAGE